MSMETADMKGLFKRLFDHLDEGLYFVDRRGKITYWSKGAERLTGFREEDVFGLRCSDNLLMHVGDRGESLCATGCPLRAAIEKGREGSADVFLRHKQGHRVSVRLHATPICDESGEIVGAAQVFRDNRGIGALTEHIETLERGALVDALTGIGNRQRIEMQLDARIAELQRYGVRSGVLFMDIDHFRRINDTFGHNVGDETLEMIAQTLHGTSRASDLVGRWGGEEFVVVTADITGPDLRRMAERYRVLVEQSGMDTPKGLVQATVSIGATLALANDTPESLIDRADKTMYESKLGGRNRVTVADTDRPTARPRRRVALSA